MAITQSDTFRNRVNNGTFGNLNKGVATANLAATAANDVVEVLRLEAGTLITGLSVHHEALGASTGIKVGIAYFSTEDGTDVNDAFATVADSSAAGTAVYAGVPLLFDVPTKLTVTVTGAAATGKVTIVPEYVYAGAK